MSRPSLRKQAAALQRAARAHGAIVVVVDELGQVHYVPGYEITVVGTFIEGAARDWIASDLAAAGCRGDQPPRKTT